MASFEALVVQTPSEGLAQLIKNCNTPYFFNKLIYLIHSLVFLVVLYLLYSLSIFVESLYTKYTKLLENAAPFISLNFA